jgi:BNR/Asp-box repeat
MKKILFLIPFLAILAACSTTKSTIAGSGKITDQNFENILIAEGKKGGALGPCEPTICINPTNPQNIAAGAVLDSYYWSNDGGKTWESSKLKSKHGVFGDPVLIADTKGHFYYAHLSDPEGKQWAGEKLLDRIVVQKSTDGGKSYSSGSYCGENHPKDQDKHWLCVDPKTNDIYCTWTEFDLYDSKDTVNDHSRILFAKSTDGGETWSKPLKLSQFEGDCLDDDQTTEGAVPTVGINGEVFVAWAWNNKIWFDRSTDGGKTWLDKDLVVADQPGGWTYNVQGISRCNGLPITDCDRSKSPYRGTIYVNWSDSRNGEDDNDIFVASSKDNGNTWTKPVRVNNDKAGKEQFLTWMTVDQVTGYVYCVFYDRRNYDDKRTDVWLAVSRDGGKSFENIKISTTPFDPSKYIFFGDYNHISAHNGMVRPIWTRLQDATLSVWTALIEIK